MEFGRTTRDGALLFPNVESRFLPESEHLPQLSFGSPQLDYAQSDAPLNACQALLDATVARVGPNHRAMARVGPGTPEYWTYGEVLDRVNRLAAGLRRHGVQAGDRVLVRMPDVPEAAVAQLAVWRLGGIVVPSSVLEMARELAFMLNDTEASTVICSTAHEGELTAALAETPTVQRIVGWPDASAHDLSMDLLSEGSGEHVPPHPTRPLDASGIYYTGGTTGQPKGCLHTHAAEVALADLNNEVRGADETSVFLTHAPIGHAFGNGEKINFPLRAGALAVFVDRPTAADMWALLREFGVTSMAGAATMYRMMLADPPPSKETLGLPLRNALSSGEALDAATHERWAQRMPSPLRNGVGMTPMRHIFLDADAGPPGPPPGLTVGRPLPGYEARLLGKDGAMAPFGEAGQLAVRGPSGITYWINTHPGVLERSRQDVVNGWSILDDAYLRDEHGWLWFHGRLDDMIVTGGRQVAPIEVERVLATHPDVAEVAVVPAPDALRGQVVTAFVRLQPDRPSGPGTTQQLQDFCKSQMAAYKYPRRIEYVDELPKDPVGKLQRRKLRDLLRAEAPS
ncbi:acyl--CoA ligase [Nocardioides carbamazepini]|uniref:acyl-CoA synthetase n=1 Tax=Nocardioides carbamazepini TaxID=2854259 RepID=UPI002149AF43|nr:class I adenylate-forming enzyme family protein [Nocardioides carbamazepini]MCR1781360.1 acyl--CoA ligase [Nocardioides carbamazepini]